MNYEELPDEWAPPKRAKCTQKPASAAELLRRQKQLAEEKAMETEVVVDHAGLGEIVAEKMYLLRQTSGFFCSYFTLV